MKAYLAGINWILKSWDWMKWLIQFILEINELTSNVKLKIKQSVWKKDFFSLFNLSGVTMGLTKAGHILMTSKMVWNEDVKTEFIEGSYPMIWCIPSASKN